MAIAAAALALEEASEGGGDVADIVRVGAQRAAQLRDVGTQLARPVAKPRRGAALPRC